MDRRRVTLRIDAPADLANVRKPEVATKRKGKAPEHGLLIDYEYCTGCYACQVACAQEHDWPAGMGGIRVHEIVQSLPEDKDYLIFMPVPTELCVLCAVRTRKGLQPACVQHCMAACMKYGRIEDLAKEMTKPRMVLWAPRG